MIRQGKYKLIKWYDDQSLELYDMRADIAEKTNVASAQPELTQKLTAKLDTWLAETNARMPEKVD